MDPKRRVRNILRSGLGQATEIGKDDIVRVCTIGGFH